MLLCSDPVIAPSLSPRSYGWLCYPGDLSDSFFFSSRLRLTRLLYLTKLDFLLHCFRLHHQNGARESWSVFPMAPFAYVPLYKNPLSAFQRARALHLSFGSSEPSIHPFSFISYVNRFSFCSTDACEMTPPCFRSCYGHHNRKTTGNKHQNRMRVVLA